MFFAKLSALHLVTLQAQSLPGDLQQGRFVAPMALMAKAAVLASRGMGDAVPPVGRHLLVAGKAEIRAGTDKMLRFTRTVGQMAGGAVQGGQRFVEMGFLFQFAAHLEMAGEAQLPGARLLDKSMVAGMGGMTGQTGPLDEGGMPGPTNFVGQAPVTGETELAIGGAFGKQRLIPGLMGVVAAAAVAGGERPVQTVAGQIIIDLMVAIDAYLTVTLNQEGFFPGLVGQMTDRAVVGRRRGMGPGSPAILVTIVALGAQRAGLFLEGIKLGLTVPQVALQATALLHRLMDAPSPLITTYGMALETNFLAGPGEQGPLFAGMNTMTLAALALLHRSMLSGSGGRWAGMALLAKPIGGQQRRDQLRGGTGMTAAALPRRHRLVDHCSKQAILLGAVGIVTGQAVGAQQVAPMGRDDGGVLLVALLAKGVRRLDQQGWMAGLMGVVTGHAVILQGGVNQLFLKVAPIMAVKTERFLLLVQQGGLGGVMTGMAGGAVTRRQRLMDHRRGRIGGLVLVAAPAQLGFLLPEKHTANDAVGQMTGIAAPVPHRSMHHPFLVAGGQLLVAIHTGAPGGRIGSNLLHTGGQHGQSRHH